MAGRRHFKYIVRDQYGFVIQNARVYFYQPGTSTNFTGTAYDALTGGSTVTNPFTTNSQGEAEAFFDTPQDIDIFVDDNTDTAYRAVLGASAAGSFTSFTEKGVILPVASDTDANVANLQVGAAKDTGTSTLFAPVDHQHGSGTPAAALKSKTGGSAGTDNDPAREDHQHVFDAPAGKTSKFTTTSDTNEQLVHTYTVAANSMVAGSQFRITLRSFQTNSTTAITYTFRARWGGLAGVLVGNALALVGTTTTHTDNPVSLDFLMTVQSIGASGTATGVWSGSECITTATANTPKLVLAVQTAAAVIDTTASKDLVITVQMNSTTGTPNLEVDDVLIEQVA